MTHKITLRPSGKEFQAEPRETLLEAALRSGVNVRYNCDNGTCGECLARVISGEARASRFHDFVIPEAEKNHGYVLLCSTAAASDMVIEAAETVTAGDIPHQVIGARVAKLEPLGSDYLILQLRTPRTHTLRFLAGQYVRLTVGGLPPRNLHVASCPCNGMMLQFHLRRDPGDPFSEYVFNRLGHAETATIDGPFGNFTLREDSRLPIILVGYDTGFAPLKSLIEHAVALELPQPLHLFWLAASPEGHYLANYCRALEDSLDNFVFTPLVVNAAGDFTGVADTLASAVRTIGKECDLYLSGPDDMVRAITVALARHGVQPRTSVARASYGHDTVP
jgi:CDP-4-dehydro-6-deoxyglucose reductase